MERFVTAYTELEPCRDKPLHVSRLRGELRYYMKGIVTLM